MHDTEADPLSVFRRVNVAGTERLARQAADSGVKRFVYLSSIKVLGEATFDAPFTASDLPQPMDPYGQSKLEAEQALEKLAAESGLEVVIIRPPLVYGPGVGGNFLRLLQMVDKGYPLPLGRVLNKRSLVSVGNLCDLIRECIDGPAVVGKTILVSDNSDVSTAELLRLMSRAMSRPSRLVPVPVSILRAMAGLLGRSDDAVRLLGSLQVDMDETMSTLGWTPPVSMEEGIADTVQWYRARSR
jgi:nucleoside-diphosphate-sugar epimerase